MDIKSPKLILFIFPNIHTINTISLIWTSLSALYCFYCICLRSAKANNLTLHDTNRKQHNHKSRRVPLTDWGDFHSQCLRKSPRGPQLRGRPKEPTTETDQEPITHQFHFGQLVIYLLLLMPEEPRTKSRESYSYSYSHSYIFNGIFISHSW